MRSGADAHAFLELTVTRSDDGLMSSELQRRSITFFLLTLLAIVALHERDARTLTLALGTVAALLARVVAFYFPRSASGRKRMQPKRNRRS